jgi:hypothetical protein
LKGEGTENQECYIKEILTRSYNLEEGYCRNDDKDKTASSNAVNKGALELDECQE